jgi:PhnB protein
MAKSRFEQLEQALQALTAAPDTALPLVTPEIAPLAEIAAELRDLPRASFRERLKAQLQTAINSSPSTTAHSTGDDSAMTTSSLTVTVNPLRAGFHTVTPYLLPAGADRLIRFVKDAFDAQEILRVPRPDGTVLHSQFRIGDSMIEMADPQSPFPAMPAAIHLYVPNADQVYDRALKAGGTSLHPMTDQPYGDREGGVRDPLGNHWYIATHQATGLAPQGLRTITPYMQVAGAARVLDFIEQAFGGEVLVRDESPDRIIHHAKIRLGDSIVELGEAHGQYQPMRSALHLYVEDTDALYARAIAAGATSIYPPSDQPYGDRGASLADPFGNHWYLATPIRDSE